MLNTSCWLIVLVSLFARIIKAGVAIPAPNGTYTVGLAILELENKDSIQPYAPDGEVPDLMLSVFYPTSEKETVQIPYMDPDTAKFEGLAQAQQFGLNSSAETFQQLSLQLAANGSNIARPTGNGGWPVLIFGCALVTTRLLYSSLLSQVASTGYVVISYDTPYDTDIVVYPDGRNITANETVNDVQNTGDAATIQHFLIPDYNVRAQDASFIMSSFSNRSFAASVIPGCDSCLNTTHFGYFGHSVGGGTSATLMLNDTRVAGGLDFDGAVIGDVVEQGLDRPFMLMATTGQSRESKEMNITAQANWAALWAHLRGPSFDLILNDALHYTYSDLPLILELLGILPTNQTILDSRQITTMNGTRAHYIVTTYAVTFFDWLFKGGSDALLKSTSPEFPEISLDTGGTEVFNNGTVVGAVNGTVINNGGNSSAAGEKSAAPTFIVGRWDRALWSLTLALLCCVSSYH